MKSETAAPDKAARFLLRHGLTAEAIDAEAVLAEFLAEMERGLGREGGSLDMIPSFIAVDRDVAAGRPVIAVDAGGTNLRVAVVSFDDRAKPSVSRLACHPMPGTQGALSDSEFFRAFCDLLLPVAGESDLIGCCFSYPAEISPDCDGKLLKWTKEIRAPGVVGQFVGARLAALLREKGHRHRITLLNDAVATLVAGRTVAAARRYAGYVGFILGTGTNTAYVEQNRRITKRDDLDPAGSQAVNIESGGFARCPRTDIDAAFDATTADPGRNTFEKMISGAYLGPVALRALRAAAAENLLSAAAAAALDSCAGLTTRDLDAFIADPFGAGPFSQPGLTDADRETMMCIGKAIVARAALLAAVNVAAAVIKSGAASSPPHPVCANVDGATYYKTRGMPALVDRRLRSLLDRRGVRFDLVRVENAPLVGAAVAALSR